MSYLDNFENGLIPVFNFDAEELKWEKGFSTRIKIKNLPFEKNKKHFLIYNMGELVVQLVIENLLNVILVDAGI